MKTPEEQAAEQRLAIVEQRLRDLTEQCEAQTKRYDRVFWIFQLACWALFLVGLAQIVVSYFWK